MIKDRINKGFGGKANGILIPTGQPKRNRREALPVLQTKSGACAPDFAV